MPRRPLGGITISVTLPPDLLAEIDRAAELSGRTRGTWMEYASRTVLARASVKAAPTKATEKPVKKRREAR